MQQNYTIGDKTYSRDELLVFGMQHYPKFYWIKRGLGLGFLFIGLVCITAAVIPAILIVVNEWNPYILFYLFCLIPFIAMVIVGIVLISVSYKKLPEEAYIKHAVDYYTKLDRNSKRRETRINQKQENKDIAQLQRYKKLLDNGVISQEEYEEKKKEILG